MKVADKVFVGQRPVHVAVFRKDEDKIYSMIYRDGRDGPVLAKRFPVGGVTRDKDYDLTKGTKGTRVLYFAVHETEEESTAQMLIVHLKPALRLRNADPAVPLRRVGIKGRGSKGNLVTRHTVDRVVRGNREERRGADEEWRRADDGHVNIRLWRWGWLARHGVGDRRGRVR